MILFVKTKGSRRVVALLGHLLQCCELLLNVHVIGEIKSYLVRMFHV